MGSRYLIVNADDFNTDPERNRGILKSAREGIVTSTTVMANQPWGPKCLADLKRTYGGRIGVHLNLTKGSPMKAGTRTLVDPGGHFFGRRALWRKALLGRIDLKEVEEELAAQIMSLNELALVPDHIDGNNHIHVFPGIAEVVARLANRFGIRGIRLPHEPFSGAAQFVDPVAVKKFFIGLLSRRARPIFRKHGLRSADRFAGIQRPAVWNLGSVRSFLARLPDGITELMCHPGYPNAGNPFSNLQREQELSVLTHPALMEEVKRRRIRLISYGEMEP